MLLRVLSSKRQRIPLNFVRKFSVAPPEYNFSSISSIKEVEANRIFQLEKLQALKASEFSPLQLNQLITDFLIKPNPPDVTLAGKLLEKYLFKFPEIDEKGDLSSLYLIQLLNNAELGSCVHFLKLLLKKPEFMNVLNSQFIFDCVWKALSDSKSDAYAFDLLTAMNENREQNIIQSYLTREFKDQLIIDIFLPRLNWEAIDHLIRDSVGANNQISIHPSILKEIFIVVLHPDPSDPYFEPIDADPFSSATLNPRFHRLIELLERWKSIGIPIKGRNISGAFEEVFKRFLPSKFMMESLQKIL